MQFADSCQSTAVTSPDYNNSHATTYSPRKDLSQIWLEVKTALIRMALSGVEERATWSVLCYFHDGFCSGNWTSQPGQLRTRARCSITKRSLVPGKLALIFTIKTPQGNF